MIDHVLGRPSTKSRRLQVLAVLAFWSAYTFKYVARETPAPELLSSKHPMACDAWFLTEGQRTSPWPSIVTLLLGAIFQEVDSLADRRCDDDLSLRRPELQYIGRPGQSRTSVQHVQRDVLPSHVDPDCARCRILDRDENSSKVVKRHIQYCFLDILHVRCREGRREGAEGQGQLDR